MTVDLSPAQRDQIVARMRQLRLSQKELGRLLGIKQGHVSARLLGRRGFEQEEVAIIGSLLMLPTIAEAAGAIPGSVSKKTWQMIARALVTLLQRMQPHDRCEALFVMACTLESKRPYGESAETKFLRALAGLSPVVIPAHPFLNEPKASKRWTAKVRAAAPRAPEPHAAEPLLV